ncbi:MAG: SDR family NAD(P)-dependent oxidoreductase [Phycisphaeraceae bacterium]|nr:SDR family NAD(P)-dependent oxidoreductase [Phycisphaeraceae bacterium]
MAESNMGGRHLVVTGGAGALGAAVARSLVQSGATVTVLDRVKPQANALPPSVRSFEVDLSDEASVRRAFEALERLDGSIHCAGGFGMTPISETSLADFEAMWRMNTVSCYLCCREAVRAMRRSAPLASGSHGGGDGRHRGAEPSDAAPAARREVDAGRGGMPRGWIVNVAARPALQPVGGMTAYSASKAAVVSLTQSLAVELLSEGILVNAVAPSMMDTPSNRSAMPDADHSKWPSVDDVASVIRALASPRNRVTSGAIVPVYGAA